MKTNHRRKATGKANAGFDYSYLTSLSLMRHGCGPDYTGRKGARKTIASMKRSENKTRRQKEKQEVGSDD